MRILVVEDDFGSRRYMQKLLASYGECDVVVDGEEAVQAFRMAWEETSPYHVIFLDIMMPKMNGQETLKTLRQMERDMGIRPFDEVKIIMTTVLEDPGTVIEAFHKGGATSYLVKPIESDQVKREMEKLGLLAV